MNLHLTLAVVAGATLGLGVFLVVRELVPATPALGPALRRLHQPPGSARTGPANRRLDWLTGLARWLRPPHRQLALLDRTPEQYALSLLLSALIGLSAPALLSVTLFTVGVSLPLAVPVLGSLGLALLCALVAHRSVLTKADAARDEFRQAVCTYLDLVALQLSAAHGPVQSLERAAAICEGWVFDRISEALRIAQMQMHSPWDELRDLADRIGIPELGDVGAIMRSSGSEGAQVHETLRSRADSLRDQIRTDNLARAEGVTSRLDIPGALLVFVLLGFAIYPFLARL
ncbi:type II secretion system F family protein [Verrucosispora sp. WMMA2044]|uniref:Type II secretion system F family protein n=1 Tax=Verrucosispora sioxanthis TaxID=2499994 RepID=A0A6M1L3V3_9ACTN|nr:MULTISPECIES: type II secretion system F family protein [Micromonospora]NEE63620.1 type II secretion system F family protein [Verrucosispora sioxanthis]NGM12730.1 type II secretion system F family protein [Verrucosispora sioxanthis]WBB48098.1 type II secretion system F family protein [Verrucosispora sp. WMMA2044]